VDLHTAALERNEQIIEGWVDRHVLNFVLVAESVLVIRVRQVMLLNYLEWV